MDSFRTRVHFDSTIALADGIDAAVVDASIAASAPIHGVDLSGLENRPTLEMQADEPAKQWENVARVLDLLLENGVARDGCLFGVGGGVLCDLAAFAASIYMRGIDCVLMPTTLLAMVDAAFGGKTGMNYGGYKNMVGTFHPARELLIQPDFLRSLPAHELHSGMGEVFKSALLMRGDLWELLRAHGRDLLQADRRDDREWQRVRPMWRDIIEQSLTVKGNIVAADFRESGQRAFLNLGHTYGHAAESVLGFGAVPHGTLVVWGIVRALHLGELLGITPTAYRQQVQDLASEMGYPLQITLPAGHSPEDLITAMRSDKKKRAGRVRFVLQRGPGETELRVVEEQLVLRSLESGVQLAARPATG